MNDRKRHRDEWLCEHFPYYRYAMELGGENFKIRLSPFVEHLADDRPQGEFIASSPDDDALDSNFLANYIAQQGGGDTQSLEKDIASFFINIDNERLNAWYDAWEFDHKEIDKSPQEKDARIDQESSQSGKGAGKIKNFLLIVVITIGFFYSFKPFNAILVWVVSIILNIVLKGRAWGIFQIVYYTLSILMFVQCLVSCLLGYLGSGNRIQRKYYGAIRWSAGSELLSFWCSHFALCNFLYTGFATYRNGSWWMLIIACAYHLIYTQFIGERLNPYLFLGDRAKHGDEAAAFTLQMIEMYRKQTWFGLAQND